MLFVFRYFPFADMGHTVVLIMLTVVESNFLTIDGDTHGYQFVYQRIAHPTHAKCTDKDNDDGQQMVEENPSHVPAVSPSCMKIPVSTVPKIPPVP